ncbi:recombinase family protein [Lysobacter brunescens]|uniref:Recombinase family protein n=1 Tax=Lysobacter brunescens TaxID=262323 RepID=A0ABW2YJF1_9GAMM
MSPDAQRRALQAVASQRGLVIAQEFVDAVVSGKDDNRPAFRQMMDAVRNARRGWSTILIHDTSRLSRSRHTAIIFEHEARRHGVAVVYKSIPDADPLTEMVVRSMFQAWDEWHSLNSKAKGLAGMAENVHQGFRAGGRAPTGYKLKPVFTGAQRDGAAVVKSTLAVDPDTAPAMASYLSDRALDIPRARAKRKAGSPLVEMSDSTLIGIEWNALTYAGHTVWNVNAERTADGYKGGTKRRPRSEWVIHRDTHPALIDDDQAEAVLHRLERHAADRRGNAGMTVARESDALLGGRLFAPDGRKWWAESDRYRIGAKGAGQRSISKPQIETPVVRQVLADLGSAEFATRLLEGTRRAIEASADPGLVRRLRDQVARLEALAAKMLDMAANLADPAPALRRVDELERERQEAIAQLRDAEQVAEELRAFADVSAVDVAAALSKVAEMAEDDDRDGLRSAVLSVVDRVELDPVTLEASIEYRLDTPPGVVVASPRGFEPRSLP